MHLNYLSLTNFRNYARLELSLSDRLTVVQGANAQGKTNLLEAIHLLATGRSPRAVAERELINWLALESPLPYARLAGEIGAGKDAQKLELVLEPAANGKDGPTVRKQVRINGTPKRALDLVGRLRVVLFLPEDVSLVAGRAGGATPLPGYCPVPDIGGLLPRAERVQPGSQPAQRPAATAA